MYASVCNLFISFIFRWLIIVANVQTDSSVIVSPNSNAQNGNRFAIVALTSLFFMWGFITCLNDILIPHLKGVFSLSYTQASLIQFCFFGAYAIVSLPAGKLVRMIGYQKGIVVGLTVAASGCLLFVPSALFHSYAFFLGALFILAAGITVLQVAANPYVTAIGDPATASSRLTMTQAFNALGTTIAPYFGGLLILSAVTSGAAEMADVNANSVIVPYVVLAGSLLLLAVIFSCLNLPALKESEEAASMSFDSNVSAWSHKHLVLGAVGIFVYVGAEVSIGSYLISFLTQENIAGITESEAAKYVAYYWGGAMVGRFVGAAVMQFIRPGRALAFNALAACLLVSIAVIAEGSVAMIAILLVGLCNSIMFPTIFSLALHGLGKYTSQGSGILCVAIVGGAILPLIQGVLADSIGVQLAFVLPIVCYVYIAFYGVRGSVPKGIEINKV